ncbi:MAG: Gfo/Idh/MocA family oxidoreductase [Lachnospiraceae bacterium]|nr:Gfo/Idh/MocA family oxidoreductase [Lachnospiraceae bacterium]
MKIGILGTGRIVDMVAPTLMQMDHAECYAIASRTLQRAKDAAEKYGFKKAYGSYEELAADPEVELIYVATPHSRHYEDMKLCITHKKPVLCEKSFTMNASQTADIQKLSQQSGVFAAEAIWPRYMPSRAIINEMIGSGIIGKITALTANLSYAIHHNYRIMAPELAGGALLDVGVYGINFALMHFGDEIQRIDSSVQMTDTGVDGMESIILHYKDGRMATLTHGIFSRSDRKGIFYGDKGYIVVENINNPQSVSAFDSEDRLLKQVHVPQQISGYEYEFEECMAAVRAGRREADSMPLSESLRMMEIMDSIRRQWGLIYPQEK